MKEITTDNDRAKGLRVFVFRSGNIIVKYPKAPKWAQDAAMAVWRDLQEGGLVTKKGVKSVVCGQWAWMIAQKRKRKVKR